MAHGLLQHTVCCWVRADENVPVVDTNLLRCSSSETEIVPAIFDRLVKTSADRRANLMNVDGWSKTVIYLPHRRHCNYQRIIPTSILTSVSESIQGRPVNMIGQSNWSKPLSCTTTATIHVIGQREA